MWDQMRENKLLLNPDKAEVLIAGCLTDLTVVFSLCLTGLKSGFVV